MRPRLLVGAVAVLGALLGTATALALRAPAPAPAETAVMVAPPPAAEDLTVRPAGRRKVLLVWTAGGLPPGLADDVRQIPGVRTVSVVRADRVDLVGSATASGRTVDSFRSGWSVPLDAFAIDRRTYRRMVPTSARGAFTALRGGTVLLGETSARLRRLEVGDRMDIAGGAQLTVAGVVDDTLVGAAEIVVTRGEGKRLGIRSPRFMLVEHTGERARVEAAVRERAPAGVTVRVRGPGEAPYLRHGDAVLPQSILKEVFGEFTYRAGGGRRFDQDPAWEAENIESARVPILGRVRCHRVLVPALAGAMSDLVAQGLDHLVDPDQYQGCWNPRLIVEGGALSRHAWGAAVDLNAGVNPTGVASGQDPRLVEVMERWGFTWGGFWLVPDPMHFEYVQPPAPSSAIDLR